MAIDVFMSVGRTATKQQEAFVRAVEQALLKQGINPRAVGRGEFSSVQPLRRVEELMNECVGTVVIAFERVLVSDGLELRGNPNEKVMRNVTMPTPWNQIEVAMAYTLRHPILVIAEDGLQAGGLLQKGYDWYVQSVKLKPSATQTPEFLGVLQDWKKRIEARQALPPSPSKGRERLAVESLSIGEILRSLKLAQLWATVGAIASMVAVAYAIGTFVGSQ